MTKYAQKSSTYSVINKSYTFPQTFSSSVGGTWNTAVQTLTTSSSELLVIKNLILARDPGASGNFGVRFFDTNSSTSILSVVTSTLNVTIGYAGYNSITTAIATNSHVEVFPGVKVTTNGTKIVSITLENINIPSNTATLDVYEQAPSSASFVFSVTKETIKTE